VSKVRGGSHMAAVVFAVVEVLRGHLQQSFMRVTRRLTTPRYVCKQEKIYIRGKERR
jgi:hypothetical protein